MNNPVSASAYERKASLGGGYRGVVNDRRSNERIESQVLETISAARYWARKEVDRLMGGVPWKPGYCYKPYWVMNVWTR